MKTDISRSFLFILVLFTTSILTVNPLMAETVVTEGLSPTSYDSAVRNAQRTAVEQVAGVYVTSKTEIENFMLKKDLLLSRTQGYVKSFSIIEKDRRQEIFYVKIRADVSNEKIKDDLLALKIILESLDRPKLMVLIDEVYIASDHTIEESAETEIISLLTQKGFDLVDKNQVQAVKNQEKARLAIAGDIAAASFLASKFEAQYIIVGKSSVENAGEVYPGAGIFSFQATLQIKIINTQTAALVGSFSKNAVVSHMSPVTGASQASIKASARMVEEYASDAIMNHFNDILLHGDSIKVYVNSVNTFKMYSAVKDVFESIADVSSVKKEGWDRESGILILDVKFKGLSEEIGELVDGKKIENAFPARKLLVDDFSPGKITFDIQ